MKKTKQVTAYCVLRTSKCKGHKEIAYEGRILKGV